MLSSLNLRTVDENWDQEICGLLKKLEVDGGYSMEGFPYEPWYVWYLESNRFSPKFLLFEGQPLDMVPGASSAKIHFFEKDGTYLGASHFLTGWRIELRGACLRRIKELCGEIIEVNTEQFGYGVHADRQFYGLIQGRIALLRLEDFQGNIVRNMYGAPNYTIGPLVPKRVPEEWEKTLASENPMEVLEALVWLSGVHLDLSKKLSSSAHQKVEEAQFVESIRARPAIQNAIQSLTYSPTRWIREAANLAQKVEPYSW